MSYRLERTALFFLLYFVCTVSVAQTEFPKEFTAHLRLHSGMVTKPGPAPDLFVGGLQVVPQVTLVEHKLRGGIAVGGFYTAKKVNGLFGPTFSWKVKELTGGPFGSLGNLHVNFDHWWGTEQQRLVGSGINLDLINKLVVSLSAHRDYRLSNWWLQSAIAFRISKVKKRIEPFPH